MSRSNSSKIWDPIRNSWVKATPEEKVRQKWIQAMIGPLGFPKGLISVEKDLAALASHLLPLDPNRRVDLICYTPRNERLIPLILIEFKAVAFDEAAVRQALGYNEAIGAPFVSLIDFKGAKTFWRERGQIASVDFLPTYQQLIEKL